MNLKTQYIKWNNDTPYCTIIIKDSKINKLYINENSDFCVILNMDDNKSTILNKKFENSTFTKLILEKNNTDNFKSIYKKNDVTVWKFNS